MHIIHLTSSRFLGGPERQMVGMAEAIRPRAATAFISFPEEGRCEEFLAAVRERGFAGLALGNDFPRVRAALGELAAVLRELRGDVLLCHGYKANLLGRVAARRAGLPAVAVSRGWTGETARVRLYEWLDRRHLKWMDHVVCVSHGQAEKVRRWCGVPAWRISVIHNSAPARAATPDATESRRRLCNLFPDPDAIGGLVLAAGRLSPEKGFVVLIDAAAALVRHRRDVGFVLCGDGRCREELKAHAARLGLTGRFVFAGHRRDVAELMAGADVVAIPSYTEGLPNVALEAGAAGIPVVATAVGGVPEAVLDGLTGYLVPPGDASALAQRVRDLLDDPERRRQFGAAARQRMERHFTFAAQADAYYHLLHRLLHRRTPDSNGWTLDCPGGNNDIPHPNRNCTRSTDANHSHPLVAHHPFSRCGREAASTAGRCGD